MSSEWTAFKELADEGVALSDEVKGYVIYRQAALNATQEDQVVTWTQGKYTREEIVKALRKLEKVQKDKSKSYITEENEALVYDATLEDDDEEADLEQYVFIGEGDLDKIYEEEDLQHALATYQQVRRAIRDQKNQRGYAGSFKAGKSYGKGFRFGGGSQEGRPKKIHIEQLKLRTRCARCGSIGHWAKECNRPMDDYARQKSGATSSSAGASNTSKSYMSSSMKGQSGFCVVNEEGGEHFHVWSNPLTLGECMANKDETPRASFVGLSTEAQCGVVDTAAQNGLIGKNAFDRLEEALHRKGLRVVWSQKKGLARGVGGDAVSIGVAEIPLGIGGVNGILEATVITDDVPLLIPVNLLTDLHAKIDLKDEVISLQRFGCEVRMKRLPSGHFSIPIMHYDPTGWKAPNEAVDMGRQTKDFCVEPTSAMSGTIRDAKARNSSCIQLCSSQTSSYAALAAPAADARARCGGGFAGLGSPRDVAPHAVRAQLHWRTLMRGVLNVIHQFDTQLVPQPWQEDGLSSGYSQQVHGVPVPAAKSNPASSNSMVRLNKQEWLAQQMMVGTPLPLRKCTKPALTTPDQCGHPKTSLAGAGNQYQREVWCQDCYSRWRIPSESLMGGTPMSGATPKATPPRRTTLSAGSQRSTISTPSPKATMTLRPPDLPPLPAMGSEDMVQEVRCKCGLPAQRLEVKKMGPTQGRHFYKCMNRICDMFLWDPEEIKQLTMRMKGPVEDPTVKRSERMQLEEIRQKLAEKEAEMQIREECFAEAANKMCQGGEGMVQRTMSQADQRHQEIMQTTLQERRMTMVAGEERVQQVMADPALHAQTVQQALELKKNMEDMMKAPSPGA